MGYSTINIDRREAYAIITLSRPDVLNALSVELLRELRSAVEELGSEDDVRGLIITGGDGKAFAAGADIEELHKLDEKGGEEYSRSGHRVMSAIENFDGPVIAAVNGFALGGGCELAMACHIRVASSRAKFGQPEVNLGLIPGFGGTQRLTKLVGPAHSLELNLTGDMIDANRAAEIGLVNHVTEPEELMQTCVSMMEKMLSKGPYAIQMALEAVRYSRDAPVADGIEREAQLFGKCCGTSDFKEGTLAFLEKRTPKFDSSTR